MRDKSLTGVEEEQLMQWSHFKVVNRFDQSEYGRVCSICCHVWVSGGDVVIVMWCVCLCV